MSTATYDRPLHAVPTPPEQKAQFAFLLGVRRRAQQALDALLALPRGAAGWATRHMRSLLGSSTQHRLLSWANAGLRSVVRLVQGVGVVPITAAVLSTPAVWRTTTRLSRGAGSAVMSLARGLWNRAKAMLSRTGATGDRIARTLANAGRALADTARAVTQHRAARPVIRFVRNLAHLIRPLSHGVVAHRLLGHLAPVTWVRLPLQVLAALLMFAAGLPAAIDAGLLLEPEVAAAAVMPDQAPPAQSDHAAETTGGEPTTAPASFAWEPELTPRNRAERRAQQQEQARARKTPTRRAAQ